MMRCCISQKVPQHPVVSVKSGHVFERSLVEKYIEEHGRCPVTGEPLRTDDLLPVHGAAPDTSAASNGSLGAASVPTLLERLQAEWEGVALEQFTLRQQVAQMQQELAHALQQYDAACRVIAKLSKELAAARGESTAAGANDEEAGGVVVPDQVQEQLDKVEAAERKNRKQRKAAAGSTPVPDALAEEAQWTASSSSSAADRSSVHVAASADGEGVFVSSITGDHALLRYGLDSHAEEARGVGHTEAVHTIVSTPEVTLTASEDHTVRVWRAKGTELHCAHTLRYAGGVASVSHRTVGGAYMLCGAPDGSLYLSDIEHGVHVVSTSPLVRSSLTAGLTCVELHPYSSLCAVALQPADVQLWDTRTMTANTVIALPAGGTAARLHVASASFSADCVSLAAGLSDGSSYVWDLRQVSAPLAVLSGNAQHIPATVQYSPDGRTLAVAGAGVSLYTNLSSSSTPPKAAATAGVSSSAICDASWTVEGARLLSGSVDGVVRVYSTVV